MDDVENQEANEDDSDSDSETNMVRYYQWKRGDDGYLTRLMVKADADETFSANTLRKSNVILWLYFGNLCKLLSANVGVT